MPGDAHPHPLPVAFGVAEAQAAFDTWGCNCGPGAIAGVLGMKLDQVRPHLEEFEARRYTNPTMMWRILRNLQVSYYLRRDREWPVFGLARIQWEGPWTEPGVPMAARYRHTHWVGSCQHPRRGQGIFDINCMSVGGWVPLREWSADLVPWLLAETTPRATGKWHITHAVEITEHPVPTAAATEGADAR